MYNPKDTQFVGKHDFDKNPGHIMNWMLTFSVGVFQWEMMSSRNRMKKGKIKVRITGSARTPEKVFAMAESIVQSLDNGTWDGRKTVKVN